MIINKPLWGQDMRKDIEVCLPARAWALLPVFHIPAGRLPGADLLGNQQADALAQVHGKNGHQGG